ncbi:UDP-N-acetylmuramoyl-tripeptide--D-alanyl-D-alanine ligase [Pelagirhabdus alkalitolerans]|uniref:UDP-N-acetylmuramoyl-tripeptide--D-alanyl-D-alanine ligase n=1 Tax=Pelagirhabdus alkalitolerans TaxID=1612202 RepID=A0A1G6GZW7_9BACI|nr:UDP-N-acetylmuramoyl-tripeptide--D-alanyl-D-alanine ligase [Pelagirhabdus alkalitolerans]SDB87549.1 UDP-N-acetylmuramoyl-tripeptide--D-alanyl-D-alanine ligase [Pelagirhabdus alkalitolerans]
MKLTGQFLKGLFTFNEQTLSEDLIIRGVGTDTRMELTDQLFIPIVGDHFNGHDYIKTAIEKGAVASMWQRDYPLPDDLPTNFPILFVDDTLMGLQTLATAYRDLIDPTVVAITGSNGKTTTKDLVKNVCQSAFNTHATKGNFNNHIGLPLTILQMEEKTDVLILEMGMNHFNEIERLSDIAKPDVAIVTNIGESHIENLGSREGIAKAKLEILSSLHPDGVLIIDGDEPLLNQEYNFRTIKVGFSVRNDYEVTLNEVMPAGTHFMLNGEQDYQIPLVGKHHAKNASYAIALGYHLNLTHKDMYEDLMNLEQTGMRFEQLLSKNGATLINDAYNASPTSMKGAIDAVKLFTGYEKKVAVLGDMFELGENEKDYHVELGSWIPSEIDCIYTIGPLASLISEHSRVQSTHASTPEELVNFLKEHDQKGNLILFKASRGMALEKVIAQLMNEKS